jgi:type II secretory pathway pseudopilin PulG
MKSFAFVGSGQSPVRGHSFPGSRGGVSPSGARQSEQGFTLTELIIATMVFTIIIGSVVMLVGNSQSIFRTQQGVADMDQNARLMMDFLTRDIQESKENAIGLGDTFNPIFSYNGADGKTDQLSILTSDTQTQVPASALPLVPASTLPFAVGDHYLEVLPNANGGMSPQSVTSTVKANDQFIISSVQSDGSIQFDLVKVQSASITQTGHIGLVVMPVDAQGVQSEVPFGSIYTNGSFSLRPIDVKRYYVDRTDADHPVLAVSLNQGRPMVIGRNITAFQLRYLQVAQGQTQGYWVPQQNVSHLYSTQAVEVTLSARTEIKSDPQASRLVTLASVIRPRFQAGSGALYGSGSPGGQLPGGPGSGGPGSSNPGGPGQSGGFTGTLGIGVATPVGGPGSGPGMGRAGIINNTQRIGDPNSVHLNNDGSNNNNDQ